MASLNGGHRFVVSGSQSGWDLAELCDAALKQPTDEVTGDSEKVASAFIIPPPKGVLKLARLVLSVHALGQPMHRAKAERQGKREREKASEKSSHNKNRGGKRDRESDTSREREREKNESKSKGIDSKQKQKVEGSREGEAYPTAMT